MQAVAPQRRLAGRYVLEELIATGGMAEVWRARDDVLARTVGVKILRPNLASDPELSQRFEREAVAAARLTHPHIISVFDTGNDDGIHYIVMEYFASRSVREVLDERRTLPAGEAVAIMLPVLDALGYAHQHGLIHRDIKPGNILMGDERRVKVTDFGIAKAAYAHGDLTTTGDMLGTVRYVSPEQVEGGEIDARSDLYSAGVVLYEMVTGRPPFLAETDIATAMMRLTSQPLPPRAVRPGIPKTLEAVVTKAMARRPEDRFSSAESMHTALERQSVPVDSSMTQPLPQIEESEEPAAARRGAGLRSWMLIPLTLVVLAGAVIAAGLAFGRLEIGGPLGVRAAPQEAEGSKAAGGRVRIVEARDYDPEGDGSENPNQTSLALDGEPSTAWKTDHYSTADFGRLKDGVGLWLDLGKSTEVDRVTIRTGLPGWSFQLRTGTLDRLSGPLKSEGGRSTFVTASSARTVITFRSVKTSGVLIWITALAPDEGRFAAAVGEVFVQGPS